MKLSRSLRKGQDVTIHHIDGETTLGEVAEYDEHAVLLSYDAVLYYVPWASVRLMVFEPSGEDTVKSERSGIIL